MRKDLPFLLMIPIARSGFGQKSNANEKWWHTADRLLLSVMIILSFQINVFGQDDQSNEIRICEETISFSSDCIANQGFQSVKSDEFHLMWLYLERNQGMQGWFISKYTNGEITYAHNSSTDQISKKGFSIYPKKKDEVFVTPTEFLVLGEIVSGNIIEVRGKKRSLYYLVACGQFCDKEIGFQVKLNSKQTDNNSLSSELRKIIMFKD
jgi:hypothetical protein